MSEQPARGATNRFRFGEWEFEYYGFRPSRRWGATAHGRGVDRSRTPIGAAIRLRRWLRRYPVLMIEDMAGRGAFLGQPTEPDRTPLHAPTLLEPNKHGLSDATD